MTDAESEAQRLIRTKSFDGREDGLVENRPNRFWRRRRQTIKYTIS